MAQNQVLQSGDIFDCKVTASATAGSPDMVGGFAALSNPVGLPCVLLTDANADDIATVAVKGVFSLAVDPAGAMAAGDPVYLDVATGALDDDSAANFLFGYVMAAVPEAGATVPVRLTGG